MIFRTLILAGLLVIGAARAATFGQLEYSVPAGWTVKTNEAGVTLTPDHLTLGDEVGVTLFPGKDFSGDFAQWFAQTNGGIPGFSVVSRSSVEKGQAKGSVPLLAQAVVLKNKAGQQIYMYYQAANPKGRVELLVYAASSLEAFKKYQPQLSALTDSLKFVPTVASSENTPKTDAQTVGTGSSTLPALKAPKLAELLAQGFNPAKQPIPDEFRCYPQVSSDKYAQPTFSLQFFEGGRYRVPGADGTYTLKQDGSLSYVQFKTGPLLGTDDSYLQWNKKQGQTIELNNYPLKNDDTVDIYCYQRGSREAVARDLFRRKDPQVGKYPCRSTDGKNTDMGALEILAGRQYRYKGEIGKYSVAILRDQDTDYAGPKLEFVGGPLEDYYVSYFEKDDGERELSFLKNGSCKLVVKPSVLPQFGPDKAPTPPKGSGGLEGAFSKQRQQMMVGGGLEFVRDFYIFSKNGYVFTADPDTSLADADCSHTYPSGLPVCEVYRVQSGFITIGKDKAEKLERKSNTLVLDGDVLEPVRPVGNLVLEGEYKSTSVFTAVVGSGGGIFYNYLKFGKDGRFTRERSGGISITTTTDGTAFGETTGGVSSSSTRKNGGKYSFAGNTLTLNYDDGRIEKLFAMVPQLKKDGKPDLEWLYLSGRDYFYQDPSKKD